MEDIPALPSLRFPWKKVLAFVISIVAGATSIVGASVGLIKDGEISNISDEKRKGKKLAELKRQTQIYTGSVEGGRAQVKEIQKYYDNQLRNRWNIREQVERALREAEKNH